MSDKIEVNPTPIQRNLFDVAVDLTKLYYENFAMNSLEEVQETYLKFYAVAVMAYRGKIDLSKYIPDNS